MGGDPTIQAHLSLVDEFRRRFPLFDRLAGSFGADGGGEEIPWFFGFLMAAAMNPRAGGTCFILEKTPGTTAIAAVLTAFSLLKSDFPNLVREYARHAFPKGQRVRVRPSNFVYEYEGLWADYPGFFRLKILGEAAGRSFQLEEVLRLEPTDRLRPKGTGVSDLGSFESSPLDQLLDLSSCGNNSILRNQVLCHMARAQFGRILESVILAPRKLGKFDPLSQFLSWGSIAANGLPRSNDSYQTTGEPLIAVSAIAEDIALACKGAPPNSKIVFADGPQRLARDLQAYDDITAQQRLIVLASPSDTDELEVLRNRGCLIWRMSPDELLVGEAVAHNRSRTSLVGASVRAAEIRRRAHVTAIECAGGQFEKAAAALERASASLDGNEPPVELEDGIARLFGVLFECSECCFGPPEGTLANLQAARSAITWHDRWLSPACVSDLKEAIDGLDIAARNGTGDAKATALIELLSDRIVGNGESWAVVARSPRVAASLLAGIKQWDISPPVTAISSLTFGQEYDGVILAGWPNDLRFRRLNDLAVAPETKILMYPFERKWLDRYRVRFRERERMNAASKDQRAEIIQVDASHFTIPDRPEIHSPEEQTAPEQEPSIFRLEARIARRRADAQTLIEVGDFDETRPTRLVRFTGACHAFLTEWAEVPVLNDIIDQGEAGSAKMGRKTVSDFMPGDFLLFRAAGDKGFVRLIAEDIMGGEEYERLRVKAERWKLALRRLGSGPAAVQRRLADFGLERTTVTIGHWLGNSDMIGPGSNADLEVIARAAQDAELLSSRDRIADAISRVRGAHLSAGMRLTKLLLDELRGRVAELRDEPTLLDLGYGEAWVVQVESVGDDAVNCPVNKTNRLQWAADTGF